MTGETSNSGNTGTASPLSMNTTTARAIIESPAEPIPLGTVQNFSFVEDGTYSFQDFAAAARSQFMQRVPRDPVLQDDLVNAARRRLTEAHDLHRGLRFSRVVEGVVLAVYDGTFEVEVAADPEPFTLALSTDQALPMEDRADVVEGSLVTLTVATDFSRARRPSQVTAARLRRFRVWLDTELEDANAEATFLSDELRRYAGGDENASG